MPAEEVPIFLFVVAPIEAQERLRFFESLFLALEEAGLTFFGLLHALSGDRVLPAIPPDDAMMTRDGRIPDWLAQVRGYMTVGSPIDNHLLLWPALFCHYDFMPARNLFEQREPIKWRNYHDYGDPVGFSLSATRRWLATHGECKPFDLTEKNDIGFARQILPGKAHNAYFDDALVFDHFFLGVVKDRAEMVPPPRSRGVVYVLSSCAISHKLSPPIGR